jgi:adrenodoxin-NADP+ reductase
MAAHCTCHGHAQDEMKKSRSHKRVYELFSKAARVEPMTSFETGGRELAFVFFRNPTAFLPSQDGSRVAGVHLEKTILQGEQGSVQRALGTGQFENLPCGMVLKSIGYKSLSVPGLSFDDYQGRVPNAKGRVLRSGQGTEGTAIENGLYVVGWLKRGPSGIIGTNLVDAEETVCVKSLRHQLCCSPQIAPFWHDLTIGFCNVCALCINMSQGFCL